MAGRAFAIGDVHGRIDLLEALLGEIRPRPSDLLIFVGDYVDRGPASPHVLDRLIALADEARCVFLRGNHDVSFESVARRLGRLDVAQYTDPDFGGGATLSAYGADPETAAGLAVPEAHLTFLHALAPSFEVERGGERIVVTHAGVDLARPLGEQRTRDLVWGRQDFLAGLADAVLAATAGPFADRLLVFGHYQSLDGHDHRPRGVGIDTGCGTLAGGRLTALDLDAMTACTVG